MGTPVINLGLLGGNANLTMTGYTGYVLRLTSNVGNITAYDFGGANQGGIKGTLSQTSNSSTNANGAGPSNANNSVPPASGVALGDIGNGDSHFMGVAAQQAVSVAPSEDWSPTGNTYSNQSNSLVFIGSGTTLTAAIGIQGAFQSNTVDVAYVVAKNGTTLGFTGAEIQEQGLGSKTVVTNTFTAGPATPEPASLGVLTLGALGLIARRRRA
jgi:hypothetical protein